MHQPLQLSRRAGWTLAVIATLAMTVSYVDRQVLSVLAPTVCEALSIGQTQYGILTAAFSLSYLVGAPLAGWLLDHVGPRRGLLVSIVVWSAVSAVHAVAPSFGVLLALRIALGAAEAPSFPGAALTVRRALPPSDRSAGYGLIFTGSSIGAMIAGPLSIWLKIHFDWRIAFAGASFCGMLWLPAWFLATRGERGRLLDAGEREASPRPTPHRTGLDAGSKASWREVLSSAAVLRAVVLVFVSAPLMLFVFNWYAKFLVDHLHEKQDDLAKFLWLPPLCFDAGAVGFGWLASLRARASNGPASLSGHVLVACLLGATFLGTVVSSSATTTTLIAGVAMLGGGGVYALATADMLARVPVGIASRASGCTAAAQSLAHIVYAPVIGGILARTHSYVAVVLLVGSLVLPGALIFRAWPIRSAPTV